MIVERDEDVLDVSLVDPVSSLAQDEGVDEVRPGIHDTNLVLTATVTDRLAIQGDNDLDPDLVRIDGSLSEMMSHPHRS